MGHIDQLLEKQEMFGRGAHAGTDEHHVEGAGFQRVADRRSRRAKAKGSVLYLLCKE